MVANREILAGLADLERAEDWDEAHRWLVDRLGESPAEAPELAIWAEFWARRAFDRPELWTRSQRMALLGRGSGPEPPVEARLLLVLAQAAMCLERWEESADCLDQLCQLYPDDPRPRFRKAKLLWRMGNADEAFSLWQQVTVEVQRDIQRGPAWRWSLLGDCHLLFLRSSDHASMARAAFDRALGLDPCDPIAHRGRGFLSWKLAQHRKAVEWFKRFLSLAPLELSAPAIRKRLKDLTPIVQGTP